ncbi:efflux transporter outer membrane subunit [Rhizobiaceae bacterium BDR2-2]|uniref:Efflux transporter outer membrane subunit n=1 Tax=Ectorhizobium quercum TaxID=2965071 RepID=A0AAE3N461_9HYPH|nr:efflux transporter outer membrane subunit [Ectorhizobium quercum]MCX8999616.1 efflux transporter outer membrane subunit [Ectorhizobium quercum]
MVSFRSAAPLVLLLLSSCVSGPNHTPPQIDLPQKFNEGGSGSAGDVTAKAWWPAFNDRRLDAYVEQGLSQNLTVLQAIERITAAEANVISAGAGSLPQLAADASETLSGQGGELRTQTSTLSSASGGLSASWLLDLFGQYRRAKEGALASLDSAYATADVARLTYLSNVVNAYIDVRYYQERLAIARKNLTSRRETLDLTKLQLEAGAASRLDVVQSEGLVNSTLADIPGFDKGFRISAHNLATLLGLPAETLIAELQKGGRQPVARFSTKAGVPADLIRNRPDIRAAERDLAAAVAQIGVAEADFYPSITLGGSISPTLRNMSGTNGWLTTWSFGPTLNLPIFTGGALKANLTTAESNARNAYLAWKETVLGAVQDVADALASIKRDAETVTALRRTVQSYEEALRLSTASYRDGASSLLDVLDAQRSVSTAQASLATAVQQLASDYVALNVAMGGGYAATGPVRVATTTKP